MCYPCHRTLPQLPQFPILMNLYFVYVINIRFICDGEIYLLTVFFTYVVQSCSRDHICPDVSSIAIVWIFHSKMEEGHVKQKISIYLWADLCLFEPLMFFVAMANCNVSWILLASQCFIWLAFPYHVAILLTPESFYYVFCGSNQEQIHPISR